MKRRVRAFLEFPYTFVKMNSAAVVGLCTFLRGRRDVWVRPSDWEVWEGGVSPAAGAVSAVSIARPGAERLIDCMGLASPPPPAKPDGASPSRSRGSLGAERLIEKRRRAA